MNAVVDLEVSFRIESLHGTCFMFTVFTVILWSLVEVFIFITVLSCKIFGHKDGGGGGVRAD